MAADKKEQAKFGNQRPVLRNKTRKTSQQTKVVSLSETKKVAKGAVSQRGIRREKNAILATQNNLVKAGKAKNDAAIKRFGMQVADRIRNMQALQEELRRY